MTVFVVWLSLGAIAAPGGLEDRTDAISSLVERCGRASGPEAVSCYSSASVLLERETTRALSHIRTILGSSDPPKLAAIDAESAAWDAARKANNAMWLSVVDDPAGSAAQAARSARQRADRATELLQLEQVITEVPRVKEVPLGGPSSDEKSP